MAAGALLAAAACGLLAALLLPLVLPAGLVGGPDGVGAGLVAGTALAQALGALVVAAWGTSARRRRGASGLAAEVGLRFRAADLPVGVAVAVGALIAVGVLVSVLTQAGLLPAGEVDNTTVLVAGSDQAGEFVLLVLAVVVVGPFAEEVLFRGLFLRALTRRLGPAVAVVASSAVFGLLHLQPGRGGLGLVLVTGTLGVVLAVLTLRTGRLGPALVAHSAFNATTVLLAAVAQTVGTGPGTT